MTQSYIEIDAIADTACPHARPVVVNVSGKAADCYPLAVSAIKNGVKTAVCLECIVEKMESLGYVIRKPFADDRRSAHS
jgi:hypothetical protein